MESMAACRGRQWIWASGATFGKMMAIGYGCDKGFPKFIYSADVIWMVGMAAIPMVWSCEEDSAATKIWKFELCTTVW
jgi:hypothetical protein